MTDKFAATSAVGLVLFQEEGEEADGLYHWLVVRSVSVVRDDPSRPSSLSLSLALSRFTFDLTIPLQHVGATPTDAGRSPWDLEAGAAAAGAGRAEAGRAGRAVGGHDWSSSDELTIRRTGISCFCLPLAGSAGRPAPSLRLRARD